MCAVKVTGPVTVPSGLTAASPAMDPGVPRTVMAPQKCLTRNSAVDPTGSSTQLPPTVPSASCDVAPGVVDPFMLQRAGRAGPAGPDAGDGVGGADSCGIPS